MSTSSVRCWPTIMLTHGLIAALALLSGWQADATAGEPRRAVSHSCVSVLAMSCTSTSVGTEPPADSPVTTNQDRTTSKDDITAALRRGLPIVQKSAANYPEHRKCFSCHHQTLPMLTVVAARDAGLPIDQNLLQSQAEFTRKSFLRDTERLREGKDIGGRAMTVGYGLWALSLANAGADDTTTAMVEYLVKTQHDDGHWPAELHWDLDIERNAMAILFLKQSTAPVLTGK